QHQVQEVIQVVQGGLNSAKEGTISTKPVGSLLLKKETRGYKLKPPQRKTPCGANFFDVGLRIIIKQSAVRHGTTEAHGAVNWGITFGFSERLAKAWDAEGRDKQIAIVSKAGAGEGNPDA
ncbi:hypothetical protein BXZ70DRAFT_911046, partial [Cristinia sonorae]